MSYIGRFAPSPTGPLHSGSLVAALASCLDARAHDGRWLLRIEDIDPPREVPGATRSIIETLRAFGFEPDGEIVLQSTRLTAYQAAFERLQASGLVYPCTCTRREIADSLQPPDAARLRHQERVYPGTCRHGARTDRSARAWRIRVDEQVIEWHDRARNGPIRVELATRVGDFVLRRADGLWAYQLAVVVDDDWQGVTQIVRGEDLFESTARQIHLQQCLGLSRPHYLHLPLVVDARGEKLSKQTGAPALDGRKADRAIEALDQALAHLGLSATRAATVGGFWREAVEQWRRSRWMREA
ncbi:MAG: tRNA glutamyl-Q(34) synthetase GluQRS [Burkholderiales bacterium]|nr:tRNA glutamyl-Q(34) synthetase GluQRS [Burkholderiales bacterium]